MRARQVGHTVLAYDDEAERGRDPVDAMADFGIDMVRPAGKNHDAFSMRARKFDGALALCAGVRHPLVIRMVGCGDGLPDLRRREMAEPSLHHFVDLLCKRFWIVYVKIRVEKRDAVQRFHISGK